MCITGGEPTLFQNDFIKFLKKCVEEHPLTQIDILTNGKNFKNKEFARNVARTATNNVCFCVSLHSDIDSIHDQIVGSKGSYINTNFGIYNLAEYGCKIEIRHVINKYNAKRLEEFAKHLYNYFPFCSHYVFIGMELCGNALDNINHVNLYPYEYKEELSSAVLFMNRRGLPVSIYNIPLCLCDIKVRQFARKSISSWKNTYMDICDACTMKKYCSGFFTSSTSIPLYHIQPIEE